jgi:tetratricopeptide (TPR) repeat protein
VVPRVPEARRRFRGFQGFGAAAIVLATAVTAGAQDNQWVMCDAVSPGPNVDASIRACTAVIESRPESRIRLALAYLNRANGYQFKDDNDKAIADYNQSITLNSGDARAFYSRGNAYSNKADHERAIADFSQALALNPQYASALNSRCYERAILGRTMDALADCNASLRLRPGDAPTLDSRAFTYLKMREWDKAVADYDAVIRINPTQAGALFGRGVARLRQGNVAGGNADLAAARASQADIAAEMAALGITP